MSEPDHVSGSVVALALSVALVAIALSVAAVWLLVGAGGGERAQVERTIVPPADPFSTFTPHERHRADQRAALARWSWADAAHTRVRMPIERSIDEALR